MRSVGSYGSMVCMCLFCFAAAALCVGAFAARLAGAGLGVGAFAARFIRATLSTGAGFVLGRGHCDLGVDWDDGSCGSYILVEAIVLRDLCCVNCAVHCGYHEAPFRPAEDRHRQFESEYIRRRTEAMRRVTKGCDSYFVVSRQIRRMGILHQLVTLDS